MDHVAIPSGKNASVTVPNPIRVWMPTVQALAIKHPCVMRVMMAKVGK